MNSPLHNPDHPVWKLLNIVVILSTLTLVLWMNAEHFDKTEIQTILMMFFALIGGTGASELLKSSQRKQ